MKKIAIQGTYGSYHEIAAHRYFSPEEIELDCRPTFAQIFAAIRESHSTLGMLAIENTIAGSLLQNYELLRENDTHIIGEYKLHISHCIACLPEESWDDISEVNSHPIALMQCREFLNSHPALKVVEKEDTARSAESIRKDNLKGHAAICSREAAERYGLKILQKGIETNKHNFTRFLVIARTAQAEEIRKKENINKASIVFSLPHKVGSLSQVLSILSFYQTNLTKIQSLPIIGQEWEYLFYVDLVFTDYLRYRQAIDAIAPLTKELKTLGEYSSSESLSLESLSNENTYN